LLGSIKSRLAASANSETAEQDIKTAKAKRDNHKVQ
jgi:hypothetical protein